MSIKFRDIQGNVGNIIDGNVNSARQLDDALKASGYKDELIPILNQLKEHLEEEKPEPTAVRVLLNVVKNFSVDAAKVLWTAWKNPLEAVGLAWEMFFEDDEQ